MKVVLFCGGLGMRLRDYADNVPKPMVPIGYRPILWHVMKYYAHFGHKDFILCLGYRGDLIKQYFLDYEECVSNDFVLSQGGRKRELLNTGDIADWRITFVETGLNSNIGERLKAVQHHLVGEEMFLANYSDGLTDLPLDLQIEDVRRRNKLASFLSVRPNLSYHFVSSDNGFVTSFKDIAQSGLRVNGGFFVFRNEVFDYLRAGEELVEEPFARLVEQRQLVAYDYDGFWVPMDTAKDKKRLDDLYEGGKPPWQLWRNNVSLMSPGILSLESGDSARKPAAAGSR